ncbi:MAG TPA: hypothetical protein VGN17_10970 [Bryobacteraceae bacterium]|jgi:hypothetical protein
MNFKLIVMLSMFGLAMGVATVFWIPSNVEPVFWLPIFLVCAYAIARECGERLFAHGLWLGVVNSVWITATHAVFADQYLTRHASEAELLKMGPFSGSPRVTMALMGPLVGVVSGAVIGLFALVAGRFVGRRKSVAAG